MRKALLFIFILAIASVVSVAQECPKMWKNTLVKTSTTYINAPEINNGNDTVFYQVSFIENINGDIGWAICDDYYLQITGSIEGVPFTRKKIECVPITGIFQAWLPPAKTKAVIMIYQVTCKYNGMPIKSGSFILNPKKKR